MLAGCPPYTYQITHVHSIANCLPSFISFFPPQVGLPKSRDLKCFSNSHPTPWAHRRSTVLVAAMPRLRAWSSRGMRALQRRALRSLLRGSAKAAVRAGEQRVEGRHGCHDQSIGCRFAIVCTGAEQRHAQGRSVRLTSMHMRYVTWQHQHSH